MKFIDPFLRFLLLTFFLSAIGFGQSAPSEITVAGLKNPVTVNRDARAVPYIEAANDADLYFMQGWVTASDRLWQMDLLRSAARGETAEIFGKQTLEEDKRWRRYGFARVADQSLVHIAPEPREALESYARGVNAYIATLDEKTLPVEFRILQYRPREWTPADSIIIGKILADALSSTYRLDLVKQLLAAVDPEKRADLERVTTPYDVVLFGTDVGDKPRTEEVSPAKTQSRKAGNSVTSLSSILPIVNREMDLREASLRRVGLYAEGLAASNNWVISGKRTADGRPILANDPHLMPSAPGIWYISHLESPGMRVAGVTFPGVPGIVLGHNEHIAWGATNVGPDVQDLYLETFNDKGEYQTPDGWRAAVVRKEEIRVRTSPLKPDTTAETIEVVETRHGPMIVDDGKQRMALRWTAFDVKNSDLGAFYYLNRARDWATFRQALSGYGGAMQNFVYADVKGNIGWQTAGKVPVRRTGDGSLPYDGKTNDGDWTGFIPFGDLPHLYNPPEGFIVTANQRIVGTNYRYPQLVRDFAAPWRARRLHNLLSMDAKATVESVSAAQHDVYNLPLVMLAKEIVESGAAAETTIEVLKKWDGRMTPESQAALLVNEIRMCGAAAMAKPVEGVPAYMVRERIFNWAVAEKSARWLPAPFKSYAELLRGCETGVLNALTERFGPDRTKWTWSQISGARFSHPLAVVPFIGARFATPKTPLAGSGQTPNVGSFVSMRHIATPGNWDDTRLVVPLGQSGDPDSAHYKDQFGVWSNGSAARLPFAPAAINKAAASTARFIPAAARSVGK